MDVFRLHPLDISAAGPQFFLEAREPGADRRRQADGDEKP
jgi:hypothetical protein